MTDRTEIPQRTPPPLSRSRIVDGKRVPVLETPVTECGKLARLRGVLVVCIRRAGHPVSINYGHHNGYDEWCFDTDGEGNELPATRPN